jgi:hypothetical protein
VTIARGTIVQFPVAIASGTNAASTLDLAPISQPKFPQ